VIVMWRSEAMIMFSLGVDLGYVWLRRYLGTAFPSLALHSIELCTLFIQGRLADDPLAQEAQAAVRRGDPEEGFIHIHIYIYMRMYIYMCM